MHPSLVPWAPLTAVQPDLVERIKQNIPFTPYDRDTFYTYETPVGYTDYEAASQTVTVAA